jgi:hypothetical protein
MIAGLIHYWINLKKLWLNQFDKVVVLAVVFVVHPPKLGLIKEGVGIMSQPNILLVNKVFADKASQSIHQEVTS